MRNDKNNFFFSPVELKSANFCFLALDDDVNFNGDDAGEIRFEIIRRNDFRFSDDELQRRYNKIASVQVTAHFFL